MSPRLQFRRPIPILVTGFILGAVFACVATLEYGENHEDPDGRAADLTGCELLPSTASDLSPLLNQNPAQRPAGELRSLVRERLALDELGDPEILSTSVRTRNLAVPCPASSSRADSRDLVVANVVVLETPLGLFRYLELTPSAAASPRRVVVFQHGHGFFDATWDSFAETILTLGDRGIPVLMPLQPATDFCDDTIVTKALHLRGLSLMGLRVSVEKLVLDAVEKTYPDAEIVFVGHSGGSMWGYFTSIVDPRIDALAVDYVTAWKGLPTIAVHCECVRGLADLYGEDGEIRMDLPQAHRTMRAEYGYPNRDELIRWIAE